MRCICDNCNKAEHYDDYMQEKRKPATCDLWQKNNLGNIAVYIENQVKKRYELEVQVQITITECKGFSND